MRESFQFLVLKMKMAFDISLIFSALAYKYFCTRSYICSVKLRASQELWETMEFAVFINENMGN